MKDELCVECDQPTGKAGECEDSLYLYWHGEDNHGPYCETCYEIKLESGPLQELRSQLNENTSRV